MKRAVVLLSGGVDSATTLAVAKSVGYELYALTFDYGQRSKKEIDAAKKVADKVGVKEHKIMKTDLTQIGGSALTDKSLKIPKNRDFGAGEIPVTYVPARNMILLSYAIAWAEVLDANAVFIGANAVDYSGYPDCRPEFFNTFRKVAKLGTKRGVEGKDIKIKHPLIHLSKAEIIKKGVELKVPYELTWSCYSGAKKACGKCDSCLLRLKGFKEAGVEDSVEYRV